MHWRFYRGSVAAVLLAVGIVAPCRLAAGLGPADEAFLPIVDNYRAGRIRDALVELSQWPEARVRSVTRGRERLQSLGAARVKAAIMVHTDVAFALTATNPSLADRHLDLAHDLVRGLPKNPDGARFKERWQAHAIVVYLQRMDFRRVQFEINRALADAPNSRDLSLVVGTVLELRARAASADIRGPWPLDPGVRGRMEHDLLDAALAYERALAVDPDFLPARLRLGWVHLINHSPGRAREQLVVVRDRATEVDIAYLSHLFLGTLEEEDDHMDAAFQEYEAAHAMLPEAQTGRLAVIRAARAAGRIERARELATVAAESPTSTVDDPWWSFSWGLTGTEPIRWLRQEALAP